MTDFVKNCLSKLARLRLQAPHRCDDRGRTASLRRSGNLAEHRKRGHARERARELGASCAGLVSGALLQYVKGERTIVWQPDFTSLW